MKRTSKRATIVLDLAHLDAPQLISFARAIGKGLTGNANFTAADLAKLPVTVVALLALATALETTHTSRPTTPSKASTKTESDQGSALMDGLKDTAAFVEGLANTKAAGDLAVAEAIILSVGFQLKKTGVKHPSGFTATSPAKATVLIRLPPAEGSGVRLIQYSADGKTYSLPIIVHGATITLTGLKSGVDYMFQLATSTPPANKSKQTLAAGNEAQAWGDAISCVVS